MAEEKTKIVTENNGFRETRADDLRKRSDEEQKEEIAKTRKAPILLAIFRQIKFNVDLVLLVGVAFFFTLFGYCLSFLILSFTVEQIKSSLKDFFEVIGAFAVGLILLVWRVYCPAGKISKALILKADKKESEVDSWGRTILR